MNIRKKVIMSLLFLFCLWSVTNAETNRPMNQVVTRGSTVNFYCRTMTFGHGVLFYYQRIEAMMAEVIHEHNYKDSIFGRRLTIKVTRTKNWWLYELTITDVKFYDFGAYICYDNFRKTKMSALLTVVERPECFSLHEYRFIRYSCSLRHTEYFKVEIKWKCNHNGFTLWARPNRILLKIPNLNEVVTINRYLSNVSLEKAIAPNFEFKCNCTLRNAFNAFPPWIENIDNSSMDLNIELRPLTRVKFNVSASYNLVVEEPIMCHGESNISVEYFIIKSNNETTTNNVLRYNHVNHTINLTCYAKNGLNLEPLKTTIRGLKTRKFYNRTNCEDYGIKDCFSRYFYYVERSGQFLRLQKSHYDFLCDEVYTNISECFKRVLPCRIPQRVASWLDSLVFLCKNDYLKHREYFYRIPLLLKCQTLYPQQLSFATYLGESDKFLNKIEYKQLNPPSVDMLYYKTCVNIANQIKLYCTTVAVRMYGGLKASYWHFDYFSWLKNFMIYKRESSEHYPIQFLETSDCESQNMGERRNEACKRSIKCYNFFDTLLSTFNLGIVYLSNRYKTFEHVCGLSVSETNVCVNKILRECSPFLQSIIDPLTVFQQLLCLDYKPIYEKYHDCYEKLFEHATSAVHCSKHVKTLVEKLYSTGNSKFSISEQTEVCVVAIEFLDCIQEYVTPSCGIEAALLQRTLSRLMLAHGLRTMYCYHVFSHRSSHLSRTVGGASHRVSSMVYYVIFFCQIVALVAKF